MGYSGHEFDLEPTVIATVLGAKIIERHITLSHDMWGTDQKASLEVHAMDILAKRIKSIDNILGSSEKIVTESEKPAKEKLDPDKTNASYLLGVSGLVTIGHGSSSAEAVKNGILYTQRSAEKGFINKFSNTISEL